MKNTYLIVGIILIIILAGIWVLSQGNSDGPAPVAVDETPESTVPEEESNPPVIPKESEAALPTLPAGVNPEVKEYAIIYSDAGYSPKSININAGDRVTFKNESSQIMWTASAMHPTHAVYPTTGGCIASTFDECKGEPKGSVWTFTFDIRGTWKYHNHLAPTQFGEIIVK